MQLDISDLGDDERAVIARVVERVRIGFQRYGSLDITGSPKNWRAEGAEEFLDGAIYYAMESIRTERGHG